MKFDGPFCRKQRKLAKIWRAIARRWRDGTVEDKLNANMQAIADTMRAMIVSYHAGDDDAD